MLTSEMKRETETMIRDTFKFLDCPSLVDSIGIEWNTRFTSRGGDANYSKKRIRLAVKLWPHFSDDERLNTAIHEACHIVVRHQHPYGKRPSHHGYEWKSLMRRCGVEPDRCHTLDTIQLGLRKAPEKFYVGCACIGHRRVGKTVYRRIKQGTKYHCKGCKTNLRIPKVEETIYFP